MKSRYILLLILSLSVSALSLFSEPAPELIPSLTYHPDPNHYTPRGGQLADFAGFAMSSAVGFFAGAYAGCRPGHLVSAGALAFLTSLAIGHELDRTVAHGNEVKGCAAMGAFLGFVSMYLWTRIWGAGEQMRCIMPKKKDEQAKSMPWLHRRGLS